MPKVNKILIVDPDPNSVLQMAKPFRQQGWEMSVASDAVQAQSIVRKDKPSAVVLSSHLPGGALLMLKRMRASVHTVHLPVIVVSKAVSKAEGAQRAEFISAGASEFIAKAHDTAALCAAIRKHLETDKTETVEEKTPMQAPADVIGSPERMSALKDADVLGTQPDPLLDRITQIATKLLEVPAALVSIVDKERQFFKSQTGLPEPWRSSRETPLSHSMCQWVVSGEEEVIVEDASEYPALEGNRAVRDLGIVSYAGVPLLGANEAILGSFCVIDSKARTWMPWELANLRNLARMAEGAMFLEKKNGASHGRLRMQSRSALVLNAAQILRRESSTAENAAHAALLELIEDQAQTLADAFVGNGEERGGTTALAQHA